MLLLVAVALARFALGRDIRTLKEADLPGAHVPPAARGVLIMNLKSGGGKAERFHLEDECRKRGIEPVILRPGDDLLELAQRAVEGGADVIGMAGGDGSQALVASVAARHGIPMVIVPAGTRNHLALDLGLDRDDVVGAMDAFGEAVERRMDLADVNGHVFVNNVSLGLYATIVRSPEYRDAKVDTALGTIPKVLAPGAQPFDLRFAGPDGAPHDGAHVIQVSNNPYGESIAGFGSRPRLDTGRLGIVTLVIADDRAAAAFLSALAAGHLDRYEGYMAWSSTTFEVIVGRGDRRGPRRRSARDGSATGLLDATGATPGPHPAARDRLLPRRHGDGLAFGGEEPRSDRRRTTRDEPAVGIDLLWSGRRDSNPRPPPWQGGALPTEPRPRVHPG